jgi:hypothetical protein
MAGTSAWAVGCSAESTCLLASMVTVWNSVDGCGWSVWGMCVVWTVV